MTGEEAVETVFREAKEAGVEFGPAGQSPYFRQVTINQLDDKPAMIPGYLAAARREIAKRRPR